MGFTELIRWQWEGYANYHRSRVNLIIHIIAVPVFILASLNFIGAFFSGLWWVCLGEAFCMALAFGAQGYGHGQETEPSIPFSGVGNALMRILVEQWITFPRFVITGGWWRAMQESA